MTKAIPAKRWNAALFLLVLMLESINTASIQFKETDDSEHAELQQKKASSILENVGVGPVVPFLQYQKTAEEDNNEIEHFITKRCDHGHGCGSSHHGRHRHRHHHHHHDHHGYDDGWSNSYPGSMGNPYQGYWPNSYNRPWPPMNQGGYRPYYPRYRRSLSQFDVEQRNNDLRRNTKQSYQVILLLILFISSVFF